MGDACAKRVVHLELHTSELARAHVFYRELLGWQGEQLRPPARESERERAPYLSLDLGAGLSGGIVQCPTRRALWLPYVEVADVHRATAQAWGLGASVLLRPREGPAGWRSVVATRAGAELAFWQAKR
jgi:predicted enzyme related to lactoylglutathione lyase